MVSVLACGNKWIQVGTYSFPHVMHAWWQCQCQWSSCLETWSWNFMLRFTHQVKIPCLACHACNKFEEPAFGIKVSLNPQTNHDVHVRVFLRHLWFNIASILCKDKAKKKCSVSKLSRFLKRMRNAFFFFFFFHDLFRSLSMYMYDLTCEHKCMYKFVCVKDRGMLRKWFDFRKHTASTCIMCEILRCFCFKHLYWSLVDMYVKLSTSDHDYFLTFFDIFCAEVHPVRRDRSHAMFTIFEPPTT